MWAGIAPAHEVDVGHVPLTPAAPPDAVHVRPRAQLILVVFASLVVAMYCRHPLASLSSNSAYTKAPALFRVGAFVCVCIGGFQMRMCCGRSGISRKPYATIIAHPARVN